MTHQEEHNEIAEALQDASAAAQAIYEDYHNGDKKLNKQIMQIRDTTSKARTLMRSHQKRTANDDWKVTWFNRLAWMVGIAVTTGITIVVSKVL